MGLRINSNIEAFNTHRYLAYNSDQLGKSMARLSSGFRINSAADDAAGLGISERMRAQIGGLTVAQGNVSTGIAFTQTADGALGEISSILQRARDLALQYNGPGGANANAAITAEATQLSAEASRIITTSQFNGISFLQGGANLTLQVGPNATDQLTISMATTQSNLATALSSLAGGAPNITAIDSAISAIANSRAQFGTMQNRLEYTSESLGVFQENLMSAESQIRDVDVADEITKLTKYQILQESGMAMLAQATQSHSSILSLLR